MLYYIYPYAEVLDMTWDSDNEEWVDLTSATEVSATPKIRKTKKRKRKQNGTKKKRSKK